MLFVVCISRPSLPCGITEAVKATARELILYGYFREAGKEDSNTILEQCQLVNYQKGKHITILGAGIAGLVAAYELERLGHDVDIMEGSSRIGGRVWTHRFGDEPDAPYAELGAMRIPSEHKHVLHYVNEMGLSDFTSKSLNIRTTKPKFVVSFLLTLRTDTAIKPFLGLLLCGYRDLKEYQQRVGSPLLNIAEIEWLTSLSDEQTKQLISDRAEQEQISLTKERIPSIIEWSGCHPYLIQQALNIIFDSHHQRESSDNLIDKLLQNHDNDFSAWWNAEQHSGCFGETERTVYFALVQKRKGNFRTLAQATNLSRAKVTDALEVIAGTGVIRQLDDEDYVIGSRLFEEWVAQQSS